MQEWVRKYLHNKADETARMNGSFNLLFTSSNSRKEKGLYQSPRHFLNISASIDLNSQNLANGFFNPSSSFFSKVLKKQLTMLDF